MGWKEWFGGKPAQPPPQSQPAVEPAKPTLPTPQPAPAAPPPALFLPSCFGVPLTPIEELLDHYGVFLYHADLPHILKGNCPLPSHPKRDSDPASRHSFTVNLQAQTFDCTYDLCRKYSPVVATGGLVELIRAMCSLDYSFQQEAAKWAANNLQLNCPEPIAQHKADICLQPKVCLRLTASPTDTISAAITQSLLDGLWDEGAPPLDFLLSGNGTLPEAAASLICPRFYADTLEQRLRSHFPKTSIESAAWPGFPVFTLTSRYTAQIQHRTCPLNVFTDLRRDPFLHFLNRLEDLKADECAMLHIGFTQADQEAARTTASRGDRPWAVRIRLGVVAPDRTRAGLIHKALEQCLQQYHSTQNSLLPLTEAVVDHHRYKHSGHLEHRASASYISTEELLGFVHLPHPTLTSTLLPRNTTMTKAAPAALTAAGLLLGQNEHRKQQKPVYLPHEERAKHLYVVGKSGMGKSTLLVNLIKQDLEEDRGLALFDPHGDLVADVLPLIPQSRTQDVIYFNPADPEYVTPFNILAAGSSTTEQELVADALIVTFKRLVDSWGGRMEHILRYAVYTLIAAGNRTFADIRKFLVNPDFRSDVLAEVSNPDLVEFWENEFPTLPKNAIDPIVNKFTKFLSPLGHKRFVFSIPENRVNFWEITQQQKIFLANLSQGQIGLDFSQLAGALLISQLQLAIMRRATIPEQQRPLFTAYIDEFQNFTSSDSAAFEKILSEARKYNLSLVLAHQFTSQLPAKVASAIFGNVHTKIIFSVSTDDASYLQKELADFDASHLQNLDRGQAIVRAGKATDNFNLATDRKPPAPTPNFADDVLEHSRKTYAVPVASLQPGTPTSSPKRTTPSSSPPAAEPVAISLEHKRPQAAQAKEASNPDQILYYVTLADYLSRSQIIELVYSHLAPQSIAPTIKRDCDKLIKRAQLKELPIQIEGEKIFAAPGMAKTPTPPQPGRARPAG